MVSMDEVSRDEVVRDAAEPELWRMVGAVAVILPVILLIQTLADLPEYRHPALPVAVWIGMLAVAGWLVPRARAGSLSTAEAAVAIVIAAVAVGLIDWDRYGAALADAPNWSIVGTLGLIALVALSRPAWTWISGALLVFGTQAIFIIWAAGATPLGLSRLAAAGYVVAVIFAVFAGLRPALRTQADIAARRAALASRSAAERAAAAAVHEDRRARLALLEADALPLLRGIADGTLDPADSSVQERCAQHAATLRRALVDRTRSPGGLLAGLEPALRAAKARGLPVEVQVVGDPGLPARDVVDAALTAVDRVLGALPPHPVTLTVLASDDRVELYVSFDKPPRPAPDVAGLRLKVPATARWCATVDVDDSGSGLLEIRWRKAAVA